MCRQGQLCSSRTKGIKLRIIKDLDKVSNGEFYRRRRMKSGKCLDCDNAPYPGARRCDTHRSIGNKKLIEWRTRIKQRVFAAYGGAKCACCGEVQCEFLSIDHINAGGAKHRRETSGYGFNLYRWLVKEDFPEGFRILCYNCNLSLGHLGYCPHQEIKRADNNNENNHI